MVIKNQILHGFDASNNVVLVDLPHVQVEILVTSLCRRATCRKLDFLLSPA